ncbi:MAG: HEAT repeat domain-containing protein [Planctomycetota bacterium]|nr:HEAT repeat domain-containing protein [Planctomycetota bacterium]
MRILAPVLVLLLTVLLVLLPAERSAAKADEWMKKLSRNDPDEVFQTLTEIIERRDITTAIPLLETGIGTPYPHLAIACGEALANLRPEEVEEQLFKDKRFQKEFKGMVDTKDDGQQRNLARVLGTWGHPRLDEELAHLASGRRKPEVQVEALFMCGGLVITKEAPFREVVAAVAKALKGRSPEIRTAAASAAGRLGSKDFIEPLESLVRTSKDEYDGLYGVWALKHIGYEGGISSFVHVATKAPKRETKQANLKAITELSTLKDVSELLSLSRNSNKDVRDAAVLALGRLPWRAWHKIKRGEEEKIERGEVTPHSEKKEEKKADDMRDPGLQVPDEVIERLIQLVQTERDWEVRDAARQGLIRFGKIAQPKVQEKLPSTVNDSDFDTATTAMELCGLFACERAYSDLVKVAMFEKDRTKHMFAARALENVKPADAVKELSEAVKPRKRARDVDMRCVRALGYIRHMDAYNFLVSIVENEDYGEELLREVEFSLERLTGHRFGRKPDRWAAWMAKAEKPLAPRVKEFNRTKNRRAAIEGNLYGLTQSTERAVEGGLRWLELQQHPVGSWDGNEKGFGGVIGCEPAYTGLSLLAFLGAGYNGSSGKYRETIRRASEFLAATQYYDGGFPVTGGGDSSWIFAYLIGMGIWGITEAYGLSGDDKLAEPAQWGIDYLVRVQTAGAGWRYGPRYIQSDTSCTSWVLMTTKMADLIGLDVAQRSWDGIDSWLERCAFDITGEEEVPDDLSTDYDYEVGNRRYYKAFTGYLELSGSEKSALQMTSMTAVGMVCRFFMGWKRSHPYMIGSANYLIDFLPRWMEGLEKGMAIAWYHYYWYYGTLAMHQMGGRYWRAWNEKIKKMYTEKQRTSPPDLVGSWDPDTAVLNGGRLFSTAMSILALESYYRFSPLLEQAPEKDEPPKK